MNTFIKATLAALLLCAATLAAEPPAACDTRSIGHEYKDVETGIKYACYGSSLGWVAVQGHLANDTIPIRAYTQPSISKMSIEHQPTTSFVIKDDKGNPIIFCSPEYQKCWLLIRGGSK